MKFLIITLLICLTWGIGVVSGHYSHPDSKTVIVEKPVIETRIETVETHSLIDFLRLNTTDIIPFDRDREFVCVQFSYLLEMSLKQAGFDVRTFVINSSDYNHHALVGIRLDGGIVFIEPQNDEIKGFYYLDDGYEINSIYVLEGEEIEYEENG